MKYIELSKQGFKKGKFRAKVDDSDFEELNKFRWCITNTHYVVRMRDRKLLQMHRQILEEPKGFDVDHINGDPLDNRRENLRVATRSQNNMNRGLQANNTSGFRGVSFHKASGLWMVYIKVNGKRYAKWAKTKEEGAKKYNDLAVVYHGEFARLNHV